MTTTERRAINNGEPGPSHSDAAADVAIDHPRYDCPHRDGADYMRCTCKGESR